MPNNDGRVAPERKVRPADLGKCQVILDAKKETVCEDRGVAEVIIKSAFGLFMVVMCRGHKTNHFLFHKRLRDERNKRTNIR